MDKQRSYWPPATEPLQSSFAHSSNGLQLYGAHLVERAAPNPILAMDVWSQDIVVGTADEPPCPGQEESFQLPHRQTLPLPMSSRAIGPPDPVRTCPYPGRKRWQISESDWNSRKREICELYLTENRTLEQTMNIMREKHGFDASKKLFKDRLKLWNIKKNLKADVVVDVLNRTRRRNGRRTEILVEGSKFALDRVQRSYNRLPAEKRDEYEWEAAEITANIVVQTPDDPAKAPSPTAQMPSRLPAINEDPGPLFNIIPQAALDMEMFRSDGTALSYGDFLKLKEEGTRKATYGRAQEACSDLKKALSGLAPLLGARNAVVIETAWTLADAYKANGSSQHMDEIINWISNAYCRDLGRWHPQTLLHYLRAVKYLQSAGQFEKATLIGHLYLLAVQDVSNPKGTILITPNTKPYDPTTHEGDMAAISQVFPNCDDETKLDQQLRLAKLWSLAKLPGIDTMLLELATQLSLSTTSLQRRGIVARCILISYYISQANHNTAAEQCKLARDLLAGLILAKDMSEFAELLALSRTLARLHYVNQDPTGCEKVLDWTTKRFNDMIFKRRKQDTNVDDIHCYIEHFIQVGLNYQAASGWKLARRWFDQAYSLSFRTFGVYDSRSQSLEQTIRNGCYDISTHPLSYLNDFCHYAA